MSDPPFSEIFEIKKVVKGGKKILIMVNLQNAPLGIRMWRRKKDTLYVGITEQGGGVGGKNQSYMVNTPPYRWTCNDDPPLTSWYIFFTSGITALGKKYLPRSSVYILAYTPLRRYVSPSCYHKIQ